MENKDSDSKNLIFVPLNKLLQFFMNNKKILWKNAMNYGAILGPIIFILTILNELYLIGILGLLNYAVIILCIFYGTKNLRDKYYNGFISYGNSVLSGTSILVFAGIIHTFVHSILLRISPEIKERIIRQTEEQLLQRGFSDDIVELISKSQDDLSNPTMMIIAGIFVYGIIGLIISLFTSIFLKKEPNPFQNIGNDNSENNQANQLSE